MIEAIMSKTNRVKQHLQQNKMIIIVMHLCSIFSSNLISFLPLECRYQ